MIKDDFKYYLEKVGEYGIVEKVNHSMIYVRGLPGARIQEVILFESGERGRVEYLGETYVEVLLLAPGNISVGSQVVRTNEPLKVVVCDEILGTTVDPLGNVIQGDKSDNSVCEEREIDIKPLGMNVRKNIKKPMDTGVTIVDLIIPLGKGQRQLVIGDRKTGKTQFLLNSMFTQARKGSVIVYATIAKKQLDIKMAQDYIVETGIQKSTVVVASSAADPSGLIFLTPYTAMTIGEYFRDRGYDVLVILDDLTAHAERYREISLLAGRFPGRNSFPGDIFYVHSRLLERAGNFNYIVNKKGKQMSREVAITCLPVAELVLGDLSGYVQTNLMAMTDGHIYFDSDLFNKGSRPAINPFISVTRVGKQAQTPLLRDINRQIVSFMVYLEKLREFLHFGAELSESTQRTLALGDRITAFFNQGQYQTIPKTINVLLVAGIWSGYWKDQPVNLMKKEIQKIVNKYLSDLKYKRFVIELVRKCSTFEDLVSSAKNNSSQIVG